MKLTNSIEENNKLDSFVFLNNQNQTAQTSSFSGSVFNQSQNIILESGGIKPEDTFEEYMKKAYPENYMTKIYNIESRVNKLLIENNLDPNGPNAPFLRRFFCRLTGGVFVTYEGFSACVRIRDVEYQPDPIIEGGGLEKTLFGLEKNALENNSAINKLYVKNLGLDYNKKFDKLILEINKIFLDEGVDPTPLEGPRFRRFLCRMLGGTWTDSSAYNEEWNVSFSVESCGWLS